MIHIKLYKTEMVGKNQGKSHPVMDRNWLKWWCWYSHKYFAHPVLKYLKNGNWWFNAYNYRSLIYLKIQLHVVHHLWDNGINVDWPHSSSFKQISLHLYNQSFIYFLFVMFSYFLYKFFLSLMINYIWELQWMEAILIYTCHFHFFIFKILFSTLVKLSCI